MKIPLLTRGLVNRASSADLLPRTRRLLRFPRTPNFRNPLPHPARVAVLSRDFSGQELRRFEPQECAALEAYRPAILAGSLYNLRSVSSQVLVSKAIVVFSEIAEPSIGETDRNWIWARFEVPCFEQTLDGSGNVVAEECEVHSGLHVLIPLAVSGVLTSAECDCGRTEPRLAAPVHGR